jgi:hypothetical protein
MKTDVEITYYLVIVIVNKTAIIGNSFTVREKNVPVFCKIERFAYFLNKY